MGLLERALKYKQKINESGKDTLIDRIKGPAETEKYLNVKRIDIAEIDHIDEPVSSINDIFFDENLPVVNSEESPSIDNSIEEEIVLFDESVFDVADNREDKSRDADVIIPEKIEFMEEHIPVEINSSRTEKQDLNIIEKNDETDFQNIESENVSGVKDFEMPEFNDYGTLYEIQKEFIKAENVEDVYSTILFSIMGQLGVSSVSIVAPSKDNEKKFRIVTSIGLLMKVFWKY